MHRAYSSYYSESTRAQVVLVLAFVVSLLKILIYMVEFRAFESNEIDISV